MQIVGFVKSLKDTEPLTGVKVTSILPGLVDTPLLTTDKVAQFSVSQDRALTPDQVAASMLDLLQKGEHACGTILEISTGGVRVVPEWNVDPPTAAGSGQDVRGEEMLEAMVRPIRERLESERGAKL